MNRNITTAESKPMYAYDYEPPQGDGMKAVWIVDDDRSIRWVLEKALAREGIPYKTFATAYEVLQALAEGSLVQQRCFDLPYRVVARIGADHVLQLFPRFKLAERFGDVLPQLR
jgi:CheY-like chemotaxis protein